MNPSAIQVLYRRSSQHVRGVFGDGAERAIQHYQRYVSFVLKYITKHPSRILDVGCGNGWSTWLLRQKGHDAYGTDLHAGPLEAQSIDDSIPYISADVQRLPFADAVFDVVAMHAVLEHVPGPERALRECLRVVRKGGRLVIVGPHLLSVGVSLRVVCKETLGAFRSGGRWKRKPQTPFHPFGNTLPETYWFLGHHARHTLKKLVGDNPVRFLPRQPDGQPPFHGDNDACYLCNPMDLIAWARQTPGVRPIRWWASDRRLARYLWPFAGGTWVVLEKS
jgi:SAM-dependent methyltransferase